MKHAFDEEMEVWRKTDASGGYGPATSRFGPGDEDRWVGWLRVVEQELADIDRLHGFASSEAARVH